MRLDKWLQVSRLIKRRTVANEACDNARVTANGRPVKASYDVKAGDVLELRFGERTVKVEVLSVAEHVGKADALLLECEGHAALLDGGTSASGDRVVDYLLRLGIESLDYAIASHPDSDHTGGLSQVLEEVPVGELVVYPWPEAMRRTLEYRALEDAARSSAVPVRQVRPGESLSLGGTKLEVLGPLRDYEGTNDCSLVLRLDYLGFSALFCGDIEYQAELDLVKSSVDLDVDLLKVAHHGSSGSSSQRFLEAVSPTYAAISVGPDNSNLPREETLLRLKSVGAEIYRTDTDGDLVFSWDGEELSLWSEFYNTVERTEEKP